MHDCDITAILALSCHAATPLTQAQTATGGAARDVPAGAWAVAQTETAGLFHHPACTARTRPARARDLTDGGGSLFPAARPAARHDPCPAPGVAVRPPSPAPLRRDKRSKSSADPHAPPAVGSGSRTHTVSRARSRRHSSAGPCPADAKTLGGLRRCRIVRTM